MKSIAVLAFGLAVGQANLTQFNSLDCEEGKVANSQKICIQPSYIEGCTVYENPTVCKECSNGYSFKNGRCDFVGGVSNKIIGCLNYGRDNKCINCANGYRQINGSCKYGVKNCVAYDSKNICTQCHSQYTLIMGQCKHNLLLGCKLQELNHNCKVCYPPFELKGSQCDIPFCQTLNDFGCIACQCGYYLKSDNSCQKISDGCLRYQRGKCINCLKHYKLKGGVCQIEGCIQYDGQNCKTCDEKYQEIDGECKFKNCFDWLDGKCLICNEGFYPKNGRCVQISKQALICPQ